MKLTKSQKKFIKNQNQKVQEILEGIRRKVQGQVFEFGLGWDQPINVLDLAVLNDHLKKEKLKVLQDVHLADDHQGHLGKKFYFLEISKRN